MKKLVFAFIAFLLVGSLSAQDHEKSYKKAKRLLGTYNLNPTDASKLEEAKEKIDYALTGDLSGVKNPHEPYQVKGDIYNTIANTQVAAAQMAKETEGLAEKMTPSVKAENPSKEAYDALKKAIELSSKGSHKKKAYKSLMETQNHLTNFGIMAYEAKNFESAYSDFVAVLDANKLLKENNAEGLLDGELEGGISKMDNHLYLIGLSGLNAKKYEVVKPYLITLYEKEFDEALIYSSLYAIEAQDESKIEEAYKYLEAGRKKYPEDNGLLFEEINHFLKIGKMDILTERLNSAIEKEPNNVTLYTTLGNVYDNLYQKEVEAGNPEKEKEYFDNAYKNYTLAVEKDPKNVDAHYSIGALYFNKAALVTQQMLKLNDDLTKAGMKKYDALKVESVELFNKALPHFQKAESLNANDTNTLIALKEIFARIDDIAKSNDFKARLETVQGGGTNPTSYFNE